MTLIIMYALMIFDLMMTLMHHEQAGELNPMFAKILAGQPMIFIYLKLTFNSVAALGILILLKYRPFMGKMFAVMGMIIYAMVAYLHLEVYRVNHEQSPLLPDVVSLIDSFFY